MNTKLQKRFASFSGKSFPDKLNSLRTAYYRLKSAVYYRRIFGSFGEGSVLFKPTLISNPRFMHIGKNVIIRQGARLEAVLLDPENPPELRIGDNVNIEQDVHIAFPGKVHIADNVSITARCSLLGGTHPFFDVHDPVKIGDRLDGAKSLIEIGKGSFLGVGTVVAMNARVGQYVVTGSNSVVKRRIPDYSVADGNPARVVLKYSSETDSWAPVD